MKKFLLALVGAQETIELLKEQNKTLLEACDNYQQAIENYKRADATNQQSIKRLTEMVTESYKN